MVYAKNKDAWKPNLLGRTARQDAAYKNPDDDPRGRWRPNNLAARNYYSKGVYSITCPGGRVILGPPPGSYWRLSEERLRELDHDGRIWWGEDGNNVPAPKIFLTEVRKGRVPQTLWPWSEVGHTQQAKKEILEIFAEVDGRGVFLTPKPTRLLRRVVDLAMDDSGLILDSFAGSGTTGHAVLDANASDGGSRRFILVEMEDYADELTAERIRRVISGYTFSGTQKSELLREKITWTKLKDCGKLVDAVDAVQNLYGHEYDRIRTRVTKGEMIVTGETAVAEQTVGLGGAFAYCTLGAPVELDKLLTGQTLPSWEGLGTALFHMATNRALDPKSLREADGYLGEADGYHVWLIYRPDLDWMKSPEAALTLSRARGLAATCSEGRHLVFAPARYVSRKMLSEEGIPVEFVPLPFALYRIDRS